MSGCVPRAKYLELPQLLVSVSEGAHLNLCLLPFHCPLNAPWPGRMGEGTTKAVPPARV